MVNKFRTLDFLPEVFQTETNAQFLAGSLDVLTSQPQLTRVEGFIGTRYGYGVAPTDRYVVETTKQRYAYQLDPAVVFLKKDTQTAQDFISYPGIINALNNENGIVNNNERLFKNQYYSWDSFTDLDKIVNYSQYYWIPNGPDAVRVSNENVFYNEEYTVVDTDNGFELANITGTNPTLTLLRGGKYTFKVNSPTKFWIQGVPGLTGYGTAQNLSTRDVYGVTNNGATTGEVVFTVPAKTAQSQYDLPGNNLVDLVTTLQFDDINGKTLEELQNIDGVTQLQNKSLMFYNNGDLATQVNYYTIKTNAGIVNLQPAAGIPSEEKITVNSGSTYVGRSFFRNSTGAIEIIPYISSILDTLYYQDGADPYSVGIINLIDSNATNTINIDDIIGKISYTSPNGVTFINGLKVIFDSPTIPASYQNQEYYVSGVGTAITLLPVKNYLAIESIGEGLYYPWSTNEWDTTVWDQTLYVPTVPDYLTINRESADLNAWSRSNRWFNKQVIDATIRYNGKLTSVAYNDPIRAQRPIVEFYGNLALYNSGQRFASFVSVFDDFTTDALTQVVGQTTYSVDGQFLVDGSYVIFNADLNSTVRKTIYRVSFSPDTNGQPVITLTAAPVTVADNDQVYIVTGTEYIATAWRYSDTAQRWLQSQKKTQVNQSPLFNIYDTNGVSIGDFDYYQGTTFRGTKLFSYTPGTGSDDPVLGFPISYSSSNTIGDINFTVNLNEDTFIYNTGINSTVTKNINIGFVRQYVANVATKRSGWVTAESQSIQYQVFEFTVSALDTTRFTCDVPATQNSKMSNSQVYVDDNLIDRDQYTLTIDATAKTTLVTLNTAVNTGQKVTVLLLSDLVSPTAYYQVPSNLQNNPFNTNITVVASGDIRNQYRSIFGNAPGVTGELFGENNIYNLENLTRYGSAIIQNSASLVLPGVFLRKSEYNLFEALQFNSDEYINYKNLLADTTVMNDFSIYQTPAQMLDTVIYQISSTKNETGSFFWSDMLFSGSPYRTNTYSFAAPASSITLSLSRTYDFSNANYYGLGIYVTRIVGNRSVTTQLISGVNYTVSSVSPAVTIYGIQTGDVVTINEYNQTYGSYCPNTPTKLGLYAAFIPRVVYDDTYSPATYFIKGHDGSYNKLYGTYENGQLTDFRDQVLLEFETRIYNNLKVTGAIPVQADEIIPGQWRTTDYTREEVLQIYSINFLKWVGKNRIDYKTQIYNSTNEFTYNYNQTNDKLTSDVIQQGYWRGIYNWYYDTSDPANSPWEMLGLANEPSWWTSRYGVAPYTSDNTLMWTEISRGFVWNNGNSYINPYKVRPQLLSELPVNQIGQLVSPLTSVVGNYSTQSFNRSWVVGDQGPAETSYLRSSSWPFDLMRITALTKPAKFFNLNADRDRYKYNSELNQYLYDDRYHLDPKTVQVYGNGVAKHSYINWVVDYVNQRGVDGTTAITDTLANLDVRLTYNIAGFSAKNYLKFLIEKSTPNTQNSSLLIPDDSYSVLLYDNVPEDRITYSSVIIQKTIEGYTVWGNSQEKPYFAVATPKVGRTNTLSVEGLSVTLSENYYTDKTVIVPYGTVFYSVQGVSEFLRSYGVYLTSQGIKFDYVADNVTYDWDQMIQEFMYWCQQSWQTGSTISLNPNAKLFSVLSDGLVVNPLTIQQENFILNQNLVPLQSKDAAVIREQIDDTQSFTVRVLSDGDTVAYTNLNLSSMEHAVVFDNTTIFNDTIYNLVTGLRQNRLLLKGYKTAEWNGYINTSGFILNENNVKEWEPNVKYAKGRIVTYKGTYWAAARLIEPVAEFSKEVWIETDYSEIKVGLLPNPSTNAYESLYYYDTYVANLENDADLLAFSLIGYRPRQYLADADLSDITQVNVYKNIVNEKGTNLIANAFKQANLAKGKIDYDVYENWAIKNCDFGSVLNSNYVEFLLEQSKLTGNPTIVGFSTTDDTVPDTQQTVNVKKQLINYERPPQTADFLPSYSPQMIERGLPTAGFVNLNDVKFTTYTLNDLNISVVNTDTLYRGDNVWVASYRGSWQVFTPVTINTQITLISNNLNGSVNIQFAGNHNLVKDDPIVIFNMDPSVNGYYTVSSVDSLSSITVNLSLDPSVLQLIGPGLMFKLVERKFAQASDQTNVIANSEFFSKRSWVETDVDDNWAVWENGPFFKSSPVVTQSASDWGVAVAYTDLLGYIYANSSGTIYRYLNEQNNELIQYTGSTANTEIIAFDQYAYISDPTNGIVAYYEMLPNTVKLQYVQAINMPNTGAIAVSADRQWLYIANKAARTIAVFCLDQYNQYVFANTFNGPANATNFGETISTSTDGVKLIVGAPLHDSGAITDSGIAYVYSRAVEQFDVSTSDQTVFTTAYAIPNGVADIFVDNVLVTLDVTVSPGGTVTFTYPPAIGSIVTVSYSHMELQQVLQPRVPQVGQKFGQSVDTNRYGAEILVGAPYELSSVKTVSDSEGSVYRWTNSGQRYGTATFTVFGSQTGTIFIDGFRVDFNGTAEDIAAQIRLQQPTNVTATVSGQNITIGTIDGTVDVANNILDITGSVSNLAKLLYQPYTQTQIINGPVSNMTGSFGYALAMNETDSLVVSGPTSIRRSETTFDFSDDYANNDTIFDNGATTFVDIFPNSGVVYEYDYLPAANESITNPGKYVFGQYIQTTDVAGIATEPLFGTSVSYSDGVIMVGAPDWSANGNGLVLQFNSTTPSSWFIDKKPLPMVAVDKLNNISIYDTTDNETLDYLDYIDPVQGKLLGAVATNIDFITSTDPAGYDVDFVWTDNKVGKIWLDTTNLRILNYNQPDATYNASNWGKAFPGSLADIYTWVSSPVPPLDYAGPGFVTNFDRYNTADRFDRSTNSLTTNYYFWVKNLNVIPPTKTLSPITLSQYILDPTTSGISYLAAITTNIVGLYNCSESIQANTSALHLGYQTGNNGDQKHESWTLIQENNSDDFLTGLPTVANDKPSGLYLKYIESFAGQDSNGNFIPNPALPPLLRTGVSFRPRQTMFLNRTAALQNYIDYANSVLIKFPITETRSLYFLQRESTSFDIGNYWRLVDWWAPGYSASTKVILEVANTGELQTIVPDTTIGGSSYVTLKDGLVVRVTANRSGNSETWVWYQATGWQRVGLALGTVQIVSTIVTDEFGFSSDPYDSSQWDNTPAEEIYWIIRWLNEQVYIDDLQIERNNSLMLMFNYIQSESLQNQNYLPWLNKTSLIDVSHKVRELLPYKKFQRDNSEFLAGYLNEIKPYHVKIKNFSFKYDGINNYPGDVTDFDLPATYNSTTGTFESPELVYQNTNTFNQYTPDSIIWKDPNYSEWFAATGLSISNSEMLVDQVAVLTEYITQYTTAIKISSVTALPEIGKVTIGTEIMSYNGIDRIQNILLNVNRGLDSPAAQHLPGERVLMPTASVLVLNEGRFYAEPPVVTAYIDTTVYPAPRVAAVLQAVMSNDKVIGITVVNPGQGYAVTPEIRIDSSTVKQFAFNNVNLEFNTIYIPFHQLKTGDGVVYTSGSETVSPAGLKEHAYYYVRAVDSDHIALYESYRAAFNFDKTQLTDEARVKLISTGSGYNNYLGITARAICFTSGQPVRENKIAVKFDRTSYSSAITEWKPGGFYAGNLSDPTRQASTTTIPISTDSIYAGAQGAVFNITAVSFRTPPAVSTVLTIDYSDTPVSQGQLNRQKVVVFDSNWQNPTEYYVSVTGLNTVELFNDVRQLSPVAAADFDYTAGSIMFLAEPITFSKSIVSLYGKAWECQVSNNDEYFDSSKWTQLESSSDQLNAADRIAVYYAPTANMPGRELRQLITGVEYPNNTYAGASFTYESGWDDDPWDIDAFSAPQALTLSDYETLLQSPRFAYDAVTNPTVYDVQGGEFGDGYGPEEMVAGLLTDELNFQVKTNPDTLPFGEYLDFRISVNKFNKMTIWNTNPYTQTTLAQQFVSTGTITDIMYLTDASKVVSTTTVTGTTDATGVLVIEVPDTRTITGFSIDLPNAYTQTAIDANQIQITISGITAPTAVVVTVLIGNMILVQNEYIQFTSIDLVNNTITGLLRGRKGSIVNDSIAVNTLVQSVLARDMLPTKYLKQWWYEPTTWSADPLLPPPQEDPANWSMTGYDAFKEQPLEDSMTPAAIFLKRQVA